MSQFVPSNYPPEIMGYRIRQYINTEQQAPESQQTLLKIILKNQSNGIPKIRNDVICNGKHYPFLPLFTFTSEDDLKIIQQISTIVLRDQNEILCEIMSGKIKEVKSSQFKDLKTRFQSIFSLDLKIDPEELFLVLISDQITKQTQFNDILDSISQTEFVNLLKKIFQNCPNRVLPKILRKISKYFNTTKGRATKSNERLKRVLKIIKSADQNPEPQGKQEVQAQVIPKIQNDDKEEWIVVPKKTKKTSTKKQTILVQQKVTQSEQKPVKRSQQGVLQKNKESQILIAQDTQTVTNKVQQSQKVKKTEKWSKKQKKTVQGQNLITKTTDKQQTPKKTQQNTSLHEQNWQDIDSSDEQIQQTDFQGRFQGKSFNIDQSDQDLKFQVNKKKNKKNKNINIYLDPQIQKSLGKKQPHLKKQKKNTPNNHNFTNQGKPTKNQNQQEEFDFDRRNHNGKQFNHKNKNRDNAKNNNEQSLEKGKRQFSTQNRKIDSRIFLGINGASDSVWREKMRPPRYINKENHSYEKGRSQSLKQNYSLRKNQKVKPSTVKEQLAQNQTQKEESTSKQQSKNLSLQKVYSFPEDAKQGKQFRFEKRNYNLFINKLFWVNISGDQVTVQKQGKGYIRKSVMEVIDNGKAIMTDGLTINTDGLSNLEDGGTAFGNPVFEEFTPDGQWFIINSLDVFTYV